MGITMTNAEKFWSHHHMQVDVGNPRSHLTLEEFEKEFKVGDIVKTFHEGYWRIDKIEKRLIDERSIGYFQSAGVVNGHDYKTAKVGDEIAPIIYYSQVMSEDFKIKTYKVEKFCNSILCEKVDIEKIRKEKQEHYENCNKLLDLLENFK